MNKLGVIGQKKKRYSRSKRGGERGRKREREETEKRTSTRQRGELVQMMMCRESSGIPKQNSCVRVS